MTIKIGILGAGSGIFSLNLLRDLCLTESLCGSEVWLNQFYYDGKDGFPLLDKWIEEQSKAYFETCPECDFFDPKVVDLYKRYGVLPIGDTANPGGGAWGYEYHSDRNVEKKWKEDPEGWFNEYFVTSASRVPFLSIYPQQKVCMIALCPCLRTAYALFGKQKTLRQECSSLSTN